MTVPFFIGKQCPVLSALKWAIQKDTPISGDVTPSGKHILLLLIFYAENVVLQLEMYGIPLFLKI